MSSLADRLRGIVRPLEGRPEGRPLREDGEAPIEDGALDSTLIGAGRGRLSGRPCAAEVLGGEWRDLRGQRFLVIDRKYPPGHRHGRIAVADTLPPEDGCWSQFPILNGPTASPRNGRMLFIDLETTGLAGGAGTYAFLVGCAWYQDGGLRVRQFFLSNFAAERVLLEAVAEIAALCGAVVTYNGKSFDLPLMETRFVLHRLETPFAGVPHVDMLHPARRLWRREDGDVPVEENITRGPVPPKPRGGESGCQLSSLEETLCGHVRESDVPGFQIPARYFHFVRTGDARGLAAVMEHNRLDLVSLAMVTAQASQLLEDGPAAARTAREALGMGRLYERGGMIADARAAFLCAAGHRDADALTCAEAWRAYAVLSRRERRFADAAAGWRQLLDLRRCPPALLREAAEALAVHHEHRLRDLQAARAFALQSLNVNATRSRQQATHHRLARLDRKLSVPAPVAVPLF